MVLVEVQLVVAKRYVFLLPAALDSAHRLKTEYIHVCACRHVCMCAHMPLKKTYIIMHTRTLEPLLKGDKDTSIESSLLWTPLGQGNVSSLERCPYFRG